VQAASSRSRPIKGVGGVGRLWLNHGRGVTRRGNFRARRLEALGQDHRQIVFDQITQLIRRRK
jgi:hypothetical protein